MMRTEWSTEKLKIFQVPDAIETRKAVPADIEIHQRTYHYGHWTSIQEMYLYFIPLWPSYHLLLYIFYKINKTKNRKFS